jgi:Family of unknown function (DUF6503)
MNAHKLHFLVLASLLQTVSWHTLIGPAFAGEPQGSKALTAALQAHGGLETWQSYARLDYATEDFPLGANAPFNFTQTTDLWSRRHITQGEGFTSGLNENEAWASPNVQALGLPPAFFERGNFYFAAMPFVFADPGVIAKDLGSKTFQDRQYDLVAITYPKGIGDTPEDDYILYIDAQTHRLKMIDFIPTSAEVNGDTPKDQLPRKALVFDNWQQANGLLVPSKLTFFGWADGQLQGQGNTYTIHNVYFSTTPPKPSIFTAQHSPIIQPTAHTQ